MNMTDDGILSSPLKLPVMKLHYGGSKNNLSKIIYRLDALICSGKSQHYPSEETKVKFDGLEKKNSVLAQTIENIQTQFNGLRRENARTKTAMNSKIDDLTSSVQREIMDFKEDQGRAVNSSIDSMESEIEKLKKRSKRASFRWTGMNSRTGDPSK